MLQDLKIVHNIDEFNKTFGAMIVSIMTFSIMLCCRIHRLFIILISLTRLLVL